VIFLRLWFALDEELSNKKKILRWFWCVNLILRIPHIPVSEITTTTTTTTRIIIIIIIIINE